MLFCIDKRKAIHLPCPWNELSLQYHILSSNILASKWHAVVVLTVQTAHELEWTLSDLHAFPSFQCGSRYFWQQCCPCDATGAQAHQCQGFRQQDFYKFWRANMAYSTICIFLILLGWILAVRPFRFATWYKLLFSLLDHTQVEFLALKQDVFTGVFQ